jgi:hypothetical protein
MLRVVVGRRRESHLARKGFGLFSIPPHRRWFSCRIGKSGLADGSGSNFGWLYLLDNLGLNCVRLSRQLEKFIPIDVDLGVLLLELVFFPELGWTKTFQEED